MKPYIHAKNSVRKWKGKIEDYLAIHNEIDSSKASMPDVRHRSIYHSSFGIYIIEKIFGEVIENSDGKKISVRDIAEKHVIEDLGFIPTMEDWMTNMQIQDWMIRPAIREEFKAKEDVEKVPEISEKITDLIKKERTISRRRRVGAGTRRMD